MLECEPVVVEGLLLRFIPASTALKSNCLSFDVRLLFLLYSLFSGCRQFLSDRGCPASSLGLLIFHMWIGDWWMLWLRRFDAHGASWFCVLDLTPYLCLGASFLGPLFIQSRALGSALSSAWSVLARSVETSLTLLILGKFLRP